MLMHNKLEEALGLVESKELAFDHMQLTSRLAYETIAIYSTTTKQAFTCQATLIVLQDQLRPWNGKDSIAPSLVRGKNAHLWRNLA